MTADVSDALQVELSPNASSTQAALHPERGQLLKMLQIESKLGQISVGHVQES